MSSDKLRIGGFIKKYKWLLLVIVLALLLLICQFVQEVYLRHASPKQYIREYWKEYSMEILYENEITTQGSGDIFTLDIYRNTEGEFYGCLFKKNELFPGLPWYTAVARSSPIIDTYEPEMVAEEVSLRMVSVDDPKTKDGANLWLFFGILYNPEAVECSINGHSSHIVEAEGPAAGVMRDRRLLYLLTSENDTTVPLSCEVS